MTLERFQQVEALYHAARERTAEERAALLAQADPELRREVESLLAERTGGEFLERPAIQNAPQLLEDSTLSEFAEGASLGPYRIESKLGAGGMGEVYRAHDTKLGRDVAIKILPRVFTSDLERVARFEREARMLASLNHPHIGAIYGFEEADGIPALVLEFVPGDTLADRLRRGMLPVPEALTVAQQIASALDAAHEKGIVHRDLKPANIKITPSGVVKVLDFGLAKAVPAGGSVADGSQSPTVTVDATREGSILGTAAYMSPEQARGQSVDTRTDVWAFGCVLYELLTGRAVFGRATIPDTLAAILERDPDWRALPAATPPSVTSLLQRCLQKDPGRRLRDIREARLVIEGATAAARGWRLPRWSLATVAVALVSLGVATYVYVHRTPHLTDKDTIVLADFVNKTGDPIFDGTLRQGLAIQLEQLPSLKIMDDEQVQRDLRLMNLRPGARITNQIAHDICIREGAAATIDGTIVNWGKNYVITLQAVTCQGGTTLARQQIQAQDKEHVLNALGTAVTAMRGRLGESRNSIQELNRPLPQVTTPSLEALQNYTAARAEMGQGHFLATVPLLERAITIDKNFAMAYLYMGVVFEQAGDMARSADYARQAFRLIDGVSEYERAWITPYYYRFTTGEVDKELDAHQLNVRNYPRDWGFHNWLSQTYIDLGRYEEGLKEGLEAARLQAYVEPPYRRQLDVYICLDRLPEAKQLAEKLRVQGIDGARIHQRFLEIAYVEGDQAAIAREAQWFAGKREEYLSFGLQAADRNVHGQRREAHKLYQRAAETALRWGFRDTAAEFEETDARADAQSGQCDTVRRLGRPADALAMCGDAARAEKLAAETSKLFPNGTIWNAVQLPDIRAAIALNRDQPARSVELLASAAPYERAYLEPVYLRGLAYLRLHKGAHAAAEFQKIVDHKGVNWGATWIHPYWGQFYSLSYLGLARGSALAGDTAKAKKAFQDFFELWKDADPDIPVLKQAQAEYAKLQ